MTKKGLFVSQRLLTLISDGKCIDTEVLSKKRKQCQQWKHRKDFVKYSNWKEKHICSINHTGSAEAMEVVGLKRIFHRSERLHDLRYPFYIGGGDTKSFEEISKSNPYPGHTITKGECIGHVQKRVSSRLRTIKGNYVGQKLSKDKGIGLGKRRLTDKTINTLQNHYGMAIRQNTNNLHAMKKAVAVVLHHSTTNVDSEKRHQYCSRTKDSWCKFQRDKIIREETYKENVSIDKAVSDLIAPVYSYKDLDSDELLKKCKHGQTQNNDESLINLIWTRCRKRVYVGNNVFKTSVASAVIVYNDRAMGLIPVFKKSGIDCGYYTTEENRKADCFHIRHSDHKSAQHVKKRRKQLRAIRKGFTDKNELEEGETYGYGQF